MAMTADSSQHHHTSSPGEAINSPHKTKNLPSPWAQVVRGGAAAADHESLPAVPPHSPPSRPSSSSPELPPVTDCSSAQPIDSSMAAESSEGNQGNAARPKKAAWTRPSPNGVSEAVSPLTMSWPALSESTKPSPKSSPPPDSTSKIVSDESTPNSQGPVIPHAPQKQSSGNAKSNHNPPARQRSMKRGGNSGGGSGGGHTQNGFSHPPPPPPPPPPFPFPIVPNGYGNLVPVMPNHSPRDPTFRANNWEPRLPGGFSPQPQVFNDHRHTSRKGNVLPRGDGSNHNNYGGRRDQDRGHHGNARDGNMQPQRASPRGFRAPSPNGVAFVPSQPVRPYPNSMGYHDFVYVPLPLDPYGGVSFMPPPPPPPPPLVMPFAKTSLPAMLMRQIEYYFSDANLIKDDYLKSNMDEEGWVPVNLIAGFNRVKSMTSDIGLILDSLRSSTAVEVQDEKIRRRNDWSQWIPSSGRLPSDTGSQFSALSPSFQKVALEDAAAKQSSDAPSNAHPQSEDDPRSSTELASQEKGTEDSS